ncbi:MAG: acyl-CoA/acyl-ACP dehydrogenase [Chloroflexi bacterium]|nr:acyl-CoA/acyl-ACP dehydrogenase [Chloroflexota bacterium]
MSSATMERPSVLTDELIEACGSRAATYDRENRFFREDWDALKVAGFMKLNLPTAYGGLGANLSQTSRELQRLAERAPATALAVNMHLYWVGIAAEMQRLGDPSLEWVLQAAANGDIFAAGHAETGNDLPAFLSTAKAERVDGGYRVTGHKMFGSLTPVWTQFGIHAMDANDPAGPMIIHAMVKRDTPGYTIKDTWDTLGMRATKSDDTILDNVFIPDSQVMRKIPAGQADLFILCLFAVALGGITSVYLGLARRAIALSVETARRRTSLALTRSMAYNPEVQHNVAMMATRYEAMEAQLDRMLSDWDNNVDHGGRWPLKIVSAKYNVVEGAKDIVDRAMSISGGTGMFKTSELERLYRDVRCGGFHPANTLLAPEIIGKIALGIDLGEQPRWG